VPAAGPSPTFRPSPWLSNRHVQTILAASLRRPVNLPTPHRRRIDLEDGDFIDIDVVSPRAAKPPTSWVLVLHGLAGSSRSPAVRGMAAALAAAGREVCLMNYRGCSDEPNRLPRSYHGGASDDVLAVMQRLSTERPGRPFAAVGFSIGANMLMKLLGEDASRLPASLLATVAVSPPFDLTRCAAFLDRPFAPQAIYRRALLRVLRPKAIDTLRRFPGCIPASVADLRAANTFAAFDGLYTAPIHGFKDAADYWHRASGGRCIATIHRPMLILSAADDPFFPSGYVPRAAIAANPCLTLALTDRGGHCGFVSGPAVSPSFWAEEATVAYLASHLSP